MTPINNTPMELMNCEISVFQSNTSWLVLVHVPMVNDRLATPLLNIEMTLDGLAQNKSTDFKNP